MASGISELLKMDSMDVIVENMETEDIDKKKKKSKKKNSKKRKKRKKVKIKTKAKKLKLEDLLDDEKNEKADYNNMNQHNNINNLNVQHSNIGPRKSIIGMLRKGLIINNLVDSKKTKKNTKKGNSNDASNDKINIQVIIRFRPINSKEKKIEHRLLFRNEFDFDDKEYDYFLQQRTELMNSKTMQEIKQLNVEQICDWLESIQLTAYKKRFRRRKVNGEWLTQFPEYNEKKPLEFEDNKVIVFKKANQSKIFEMDKVLKPTVTQDETFEMIGMDVIENIIAGYNVCIFAFGQTGTGKTHTMFGYHQEEEKEEKEANTNEEDEDQYEIVFTQQQLNKNKTKNKTYSINKEIDGLIPRILHELLDKLDSDVDIAFFTIQCGFIEIYQEKLRDLIRPRLRVQLRYIGMGSELINLSWHDINNYNDLAALIEISNSNRMTASTLQNDTSSRSHCIIQLKLEITLRDGTNQINKISFGDLAGSEKLTKTGAVGQRMNEAKKIVKSLFAIKKVIRALSEKKAFVPYQDSVLTKLLRDSLGGNSLTMIICAASPHEYNREETISTLRFAVMAKKIQNEAVVNRIVSRTEMEQQINNLREQLQYLRKQKANRRGRRFTSTDFRVLQGQLMDANQKVEEYQSKYLQTEIQLLIKTQYIQELEQVLNKKNIQINALKNKFILLKEKKINIDDVDINEDDVQDDEELDDDDDDNNSD